MVRVFKIALTGGPCSGKSTSMATLMDKFSSDFQVYTLPEVATTVVNSGVTIIPTAFNTETHTIMTRSICEMQIELERFYEKIAKLSKNKDVIIFCDRGVLDNFAFCSPEVKKRVYKETGWDESYTCMERYDMVIHLVTAAKGAEEFYTLENNLARTESPELAIFFDKKGYEEWMIHPKLVVIDNSLKGFQKKLDRVVNAVSCLVRKKPVASKMCKMVLNCRSEDVPLPKGVQYNMFYETITYLTSSNPNRVHSTKKRRLESSETAIYTHTERFLNLKEEDHMEATYTIGVKTYLDCLKNRDPERLDINRKVVTFSIETPKSVNIFNLEIYKFDSPESMEHCRKLKGSIFGGEAREYSSLVFLRAFSETGAFPREIFDDFFPDKKDITNNPYFFVHNIAKQRSLNSPDSPEFK